MNDLTLTGGSPFDSIRRVREDGTEYWLARELQPLLGYDRWENFSASIGRAWHAVSNSEGAGSAENHFRDATKMVPIGSGAHRTVYDQELTRYACYLVAMNGDPRKPAIAAAQSYFAVRTRQAEVSLPALPDITTPAGLLAMAEQFTETARRLVEAEAKVIEQAPKVEAFESYMDADNALKMGAVANQLGIGRNTMMRRLREVKVLQRDNRPYQRYAHHFKVVGQSYEASNETRATHTTYVKPSGVELIRRVLSGDDPGPVSSVPRIGPVAS